MNNLWQTFLHLTLFLLLETVFYVYFCCHLYKNKQTNKQLFILFIFFTASFYLFAFGVNIPFSFKNSTQIFFDHTAPDSTDLLHLFNRKHFDLFIMCGFCLLITIWKIYLIFSIWFTIMIHSALKYLCPHPSCICTDKPFSVKIDFSLILLNCSMFLSDQFSDLSRWSWILNLPQNACSHFSKSIAKVLNTHRCRRDSHRNLFI